MQSCWMGKKNKCSYDGWMNGSNGGWMELWIDEWMDGLRMQSRMDGWAGNIWMLIFGTLHICIRPSSHKILWFKKVLLKESGGGNWYRKYFLNIFKQKLWFQCLFVFCNLQASFCLKEYPLVESIRRTPSGDELRDPPLVVDGFPFLEIYSLCLLGCDGRVLLVLLSCFVLMNLLFLWTVSVAVPMLSVSVAVSVRIVPVAVPFQFFIIILILILIR